MSLRFSRYKASLWSFAAWLWVSNGILFTNYLSVCATPWTDKSRFVLNFNKLYCASVITCIFFSSTHAPIKGNRINSYWHQKSNFKVYQLTLISMSAEKDSFLRTNTVSLIFFQPSADWHCFFVCLMKPRNVNCWFIPHTHSCVKTTNKGALSFCPKVSPAAVTIRADQTSTLCTTFNPVPPLDMVMSMRKCKTERTTGNRRNKK